MKKLTINLFLLGLLFLLLMYSYDIIARKSENKNVFILHNEVRLVDSAPYVSFGNSQGKRLKAGSDSPSSIASICINGNDMLVVERQMRDIACNLSGKTVFVNISYFSFAAVEDTLSNDLPYNVRMFYYVLPLKYMRVGNVIDLLKSKLFVINNIKDLDRTIKKLFHRSLPNDENEPFGIDNDANLVWDPKGTTGALTHLKNIRNTKKVLPDIDSRVKSSIREMGTLSKKYHFRLVFYSTPHYFRYRYEYGVLKADSTRSAISSFMTLNKLEYHDHLNDTAFVHKLPLFKDGNHLNEKGAGIFYRTLIAEVRNYSLIRDIRY